MKPRTLLVLLVLVLGLGAFIQFYERKLPSTEEREKTGSRVLDVSKDDVQTVEIDRDGPNGQSAVRFERVKGATSPQWRMTLPRQARADASAVSGLVESLAGLARTRTLEKADPKAVGLDHPRTTVRLTTA
ncbi:MAG: hypothetical protein QOJ16_1607, partial [Acidobacteriota bacterium]|nr:hypothetical protein [Acidobacteriota bacterium]